MGVEPDVEKSLKSLKDTRALRRLVVSVLGYDDRGGSIDTSEWKPELRDEIEGHPMLLASGGRDGLFVVVHTRMKKPGPVPIGAQRRVMERMRDDYPNALFVFSDSTERVWHFVNVPYANESAGRKQYRRIVAGPGDGLRTAVERLSMLSLDDLARAKRKDPDELSQLEIQLKHDAAFDVAEVTKEFFREYRTASEYVESETSGIEDGAHRRYFVQRMFNRMMFIAFVQKKGWLRIGGREDYLPALWEAHGRDGSDGSFYERRLKPLFFEGFNREKEVGYEDPVIGVVPYLNGGLFEADGYDGDPSVSVPDECFRRIITGLFRRYNFTTTESTPLEVEVAVDPEMLGKVFEELVTGRHDTGSYYTPKPIVSFMCREAIKGYLEERLGMSSESGREAVRRFVEDHDPSGVSDPEAALEALKTMRVCDPACGSGAYLLGMLRELLDLRESLFAAHSVDSTNTYNRKLEIIQNNIYGVDLEQFAANIARLRLWLSLIVDFDGDVPPPLPNLDFKIGVGDSLTAPDPSQADAPNSLVELQIQELNERKTEYLEAHDEEKRKLKATIGEMEREVSDWLHAKGGVRGFDWIVRFAEVFAEGGFDAILANPPYVRQELIKSLKPALKDVYAGTVFAGTADLYVYFYGRAVELLKEGGTLSFITPNKWFRANYGKNLRKYLAENCRVSSITDFGDLPVFQSATAYPMVFVARKGAGEAETTLTEVETLELPYPDVAALIEEIGATLPPDSLDGSEWSLTDVETADRLRKMRASGTPLGEYVEGCVYRGVVSGLSKAFVIDDVARENIMIEDPHSAELIKPMIMGKDIRKWWVDYKRRWLIYSPWDLDIDEYPAIKTHLSFWKEELQSRPECQQGRFNWWCLSRYASEDYSSFDKPKIMYQAFQVQPRFAYDSVGSMANNSVWIVSRDDYYLLGVLNSSLFWSEITRNCTKIQNGYQLIWKYLEKCIVPNASPSDRAAIEGLVEECLAAKGVDCEEYEREIDERVAVLYGLDPMYAGRV